MKNLLPNYDELRKVNVADVAVVDDTWLQSETPESIAGYIKHLYEEAKIMNEDGTPLSCYTKLPWDEDPFVRSKAFIIIGAYFNEATKDSSFVRDLYVGDMLTNSVDDENGGYKEVGIDEREHPMNVMLTDNWSADMCDIDYTEVMMFRILCALVHLN